MPKLMIVTAHQDDENVIAGYASRLAIDHRYEGKIVNLTDGGAGFYQAKFLLDRTSLTDIRDEEAIRSASIIGFDYERLEYKKDTPFQGWGLIEDIYKVMSTIRDAIRGHKKDSGYMPFPDGRLIEHVGEAMGAVWNAIREHEPDILISLAVIPESLPVRIHPDHQFAALVVRYLGYMINVPGDYAEYYPPEFVKAIKAGQNLEYVKRPINLWTHDGYSGLMNENLFFALTEDELDRKVDAWAAYESQSGDWLRWNATKGKMDTTIPPPSKDDLRASLIKRSDGLTEKLRGTRIQDIEGVDHAHFTPVAGEGGMLEFSPKGGTVYEGLRITACFEDPTIKLVKELLPGDIFGYQLAEEAIRNIQERRW